MGVACSHADADASIYFNGRFRHPASGGTCASRQLLLHCPTFRHPGGRLYDAINRELERQGQVFFLHNRVQSIQRMRDKIAQLCPGARVDIGHGQMDADELEAVMERFVAGRIDVLQFEYNWRWIDARYFLKDAFALLLPLGYLIGKVTPAGVEFYDRWHFELETFREANFVAVKSVLKAKLPQVRWWNTL